MILSCPCCHARWPLEAALEDEAGRELLGLVAGQPVTLSRPLVSYLGLFRSPKRALSWERALRLAHEALELDGDGEALAAALSQTVEAIWAKREREPARPLTNHNYLRRVLETIAAPRRAAEQKQEAERERSARLAEEPAIEGPVHVSAQSRLAPLLDQVGRPIRRK